MDRSRRGDDEISAEVANAGGATVLSPYVGTNGFGDEGDERVGTFLLGLGFVLDVGVGAGAAKDTAAGPPTTTAAAFAGGLLGGVEVHGGADEIGDFQEKIIDGINPHDHLPIGDFARGDFDDALV